MNELQPTSQDQGNAPTLRTWIGKKIAYFTPKTLFSRKRHNELVAAINALLNAKVSPPSAGTIEISDSDWSLQISGSAGGQSGSGIFKITSNDGTVTITPIAGTGPTVDLSVNAGGIQELVFEAFGFAGDNDYITCSGKKVRLPPLLRFSRVNRTVYGITINYTTYNVGQQSRLATSAGFSVTQFITPQYVAGDLVYASSVGGVLRDLNLDARTFAGP